MNSFELRFRQVHLDFHTSPDITDVGAKFDADQFGATLKKAKVNSVTCFARCHHGLLYYDSKINPERIHPHLANKNLLMEQIRACHERGIRAPVYTSVQLDHYTAQKHPEWMTISQDGALVGQKLYEAGFYGSLCVNTPYRQFLKEHVRELLKMFPVDGLFFDIILIRDCSCTYCRAGIEAKGMDAADQNDRLEYAQLMINDFKRDMTCFIRQYNNECTIFYNKGHIGTAHKPVLDCYSHFELESLPSGGWGYIHFPLTMRYARNLGLDCLAVTGKFHTSWGDFHSFKNKEALEFECFNMLALNAKCMIGDQLEPNGVLSQAVYDLIGSVYCEVKKKEPWCKGARAVTDIGVLTPEEFFGAGVGALPPALMGITKILQRASRQFDIIDSLSDFASYKVLILPDDIPVSDELAQKIETYLENGGSLIASFESGLNYNKTEFNLNVLGVKLKKEATYTPDGELVRGKFFHANDYADYIIPKGEIGKGLPETEHVMYMKGAEVEALEETKVLSETILPFFNRSYKHFCSHRQAPSSSKAGYAGIVKRNRVIYFAHAIFKLYHQYAPKWCKCLFMNALNMLLPEPVLSHNGPNTMMASVNEQKAQNRWVVHLLHYIPERLSETIDIIEDRIPLYNIKISVTPPCEVKSVEQVPEKRKLDFSLVGNAVEFTVPKIDGHTMIELSF